MVDQNRQTKSLEKEMTFEGQHQKRVIHLPGSRMYRSIQKEMRSGRYFR